MKASIVALFLVLGLVQAQNAFADPECHCLCGIKEGTVWVPLKDSTGSSTHVAGGVPQGGCVAYDQNVCWGTSNGNYTDGLFYDCWEASDDCSSMTGSGSDAAGKRCKAPAREQAAGATAK